MLLLLRVSSVRSSDEGYEVSYNVKINMFIALWKKYFAIVGWVVIGHQSQEYAGLNASVSQK